MRPKNIAFLQTASLPQAISLALNAAMPLVSRTPTPPVGFPGVGLNQSSDVAESSNATLESDPSVGAPLQLAAGYSGGNINRLAYRSASMPKLARMSVV